jgi:hypothetical protein
MHFVPTAGVEATDVPDGRVIYDEANDRVHFLNTTAVVVFELCDAQRSVGEITAFLAEAYALPEGPREAVIECIQSMLNEKLIQLNPSASAP